MGEMNKVVGMREKGGLQWFVFRYRFCRKRVVVNKRDGEDDEEEWMICFGQVV